MNHKKALLRSLWVAFRAKEARITPASARQVLSATSKCLKCEVCRPYAFSGLNVCECYSVFLGFKLLV